MTSQVATAEVFWTAFRALSKKEREDLIVRRVYQVLPDEKAQKMGLLRIIDEPGEDYLYLADDFFLSRPAEVVQKVTLWGVTDIPCLPQCGTQAGVTHNLAK
jgi:hypothetical protein